MIKPHEVPNRPEFYMIGSGITEAFLDSLTIGATCTHEDWRAPCFTTEEIAAAKTQLNAEQAAFDALSVEEQAAHTAEGGLAVRSPPPPSYTQFDDMICKFHQVTVIGSGDLKAQCEAMCDSNTGPTQDGGCPGFSVSETHRYCFICYNVQEENGHDYKVNYGPETGQDHWNPTCDGGHWCTTQYHGMSQLYWKTQATVVAPVSCPSMPNMITNTQCDNMVADAAATAATCEASCCDSTCQTWLFKEGAGCYHSGDSCTVMYQGIGGASGWNGGSAFPLM